MAELISAIVVFFGMWGSLWYRMGRIQKEVQHHNQLLQDIERRLDNFITGGK